MATGHGQSNPDERQVAQQDAYEQDVHDTRWVELEDGDGWFQVQEVPPLALLRDMEQYGVMDMMGGDEDDVDMEAVIQDGDLNGFLEDVVIPNIVQPNAYWDDTGDGDFDLATLTANDLMLVITGLTGQSQEDLDQQMDERFRGE